MMASEVEIAIIGAGVVGLAIAAEIARSGRDIFVLEKNRTFGLETSSRNSEVIHAGIYYPPGSLKARLCVEGRNLLYELGEKYNIPHRRLGKMTIAIEEREIEELERLCEQGKACGVDNLVLLSRAEFKRFEPNAEARAALFSPCSGIIDPYALMSFFYGRARERGVHFVFNSEVVGIERKSHGYEVKTKGLEGTQSLAAQILINSAGLNSSKIAQLAGIDIARANYRLHYRKGEYFSVNLQKKDMVTRLIYPIPEPTGVRIHWCVSVDGRIRLGPCFHHVSEIDYRVDESQRGIFYSLGKQFLPFLEADDLEPESAGVSPDLQAPDEPFRDYVIREEKEIGLPGLINLIGIESPGLTASPAIARYVAGLGVV